MDIADHTELIGSDMKVVKNGGVYFIGFTVNSYDIVNLPIEVKPQTHCYDGIEFTLNPNYIAPYSFERDINAMQEENVALMLKINQLELDNANLLLMLVEKGVL